MAKYTCTIPIVLATTHNPMDRLYIQYYIRQLRWFLTYIYLDYTAVNSWKHQAPNIKLQFYNVLVCIAWNIAWYAQSHCLIEPPLVCVFVYVSVSMCVSACLFLSVAVSVPVSFSLSRSMCVYVCPPALS